MKALHITPDDNQLRFNLGTATLAGADATLRKPDYTLPEVERAVSMLRDARSIFRYLESIKSNRSVLLSVLRHSVDPPCAHLLWEACAHTAFRSKVHKGPGWSSVSSM
jgi:hypothetical protein